MVCWRNTQRSLPLIYRTHLRPNISKFLYSELITVYFCLFIFQNSILHIFFIFIIIIRCSGMFRNVPGCAMFHVPCFWFSNRPSHDQKSFKLEPVICIQLYLHILLSVSVDLQIVLRALTSNSNRNEWTSKDPSLLGHRPIISTYKLLQCLPCQQTLINCW